jgi:hypothetical protein
VAARPAEGREAAALLTRGRRGRVTRGLYEGGDGVARGKIETNRYACVMDGSGG